MEGMKLTNKPSVDRAWMKYFPEEVKYLQAPKCSLFEYMMGCCPGMDVVAMTYYGTDITWADMMGQVEPIAKSLRALGFGEGDQIPVFFRSVPEFYPLLFAAEKIGASLLCRDNTLEENVEAVAKSGSKIIFAHDFLQQYELDAFVRDAGVEKAILLSPYHLAVKDEMPDYVHNYIRDQYKGPSANSSEVISWDAFVELGKDFTGVVDAPADCTRPLYRAYTSGSTGPSKQVIHSAENMTGVLCQMTSYSMGPDGKRLTWMLQNLPTALVAVVVSMTLLPIASNIHLYLNPFADVYDLDLELMRLKPNCIPLIPMFMEVMMTSERIPEDFDMSFYYSGGVGAEWFSNSQSYRAQEFLRKHNSIANCTVGYGQTEAGGNCTIPACLADYPLMTDGNVGVPLPLATMGIFKPGTSEELGYNQLGEVCKCGPGTMLGYDSAEATAEVLKVHDDGKLWLHTGDLGYVNEDGVFFVLNRGANERYGGGILAGLIMENRIADARIEGIKDQFFAIPQDEAHPGYYLPYMFVVLEEGYTVEDIRGAVDAALEPYQRPVEIRVIESRPFFHFKTNRRGLAMQIHAEKLAKAQKKSAAAR